MSPQVDAWQDLHALFWNCIFIPKSNDVTCRFMSELILRTSTAAWARMATSACPSTCLYQAIPSLGAPVPLALSVWTEEAFQAGAKRFDAGGRPNPVLLPMVATALKQVLEWSPERISERLEMLTPLGSSVYFVNFAIYFYLLASFLIHLLVISN